VYALIFQMGRSLGYVVAFHCSQLQSVSCTEWAPKPGVRCCSVLQRVIREVSRSPTVVQSTARRRMIFQMSIDKTRVS